MKHKMPGLPPGFLPPGGLSAAMGADMNASLANSIFHGGAGMAAFGRNPMVEQLHFHIDCLIIK